MWIQLSHGLITRNCSYNSIAPLVTASSRWFCCQKSRDVQSNKRSADHPQPVESDCESNEWQSEWRKRISQDESGSLSSFEDDEGNIMRPSGHLTGAIPLQKNKPTSTSTHESYFADWKRVHVTGGDGGDGCISFLHLVNCLNAGPDGGDGGNGGHILIKSSTNVKSLGAVKSSYWGVRGGHGAGDGMTGSSGDHMILDVPVGTIVMEQVGTVNSLNERPVTKWIGELNQSDWCMIGARGGCGGKGNQYFLSNENRHPRVAEKGGKGEVKILILEMKTLAHCGLIGMPNVGKSTLLRAISRARPKVASYPFTTLRPHVGVIHFDDYVQLTVADLPGLIEGAHLNRGLGIDFLKHVERCTCLMYVLDMSRSDPWGQLSTLRHELDSFKNGMARKPHAIIANKMDTKVAQDHLDQLKDQVIKETPMGGIPLPIIPISARYGHNIRPFIDHMRGLYDLYTKELEQEGHQMKW